MKFITLIDIIDLTHLPIMENDPDSYYNDAY